VSVQNGVAVGSWLRFGSFFSWGEELYSAQPALLLPRSRAMAVSGTPGFKDRITSCADEIRQVHGGITGVPDDGATLRSISAISAEIPGGDGQLALHPICHPFYEPPPDVSCSLMRGVPIRALHLAAFICGSFLQTERGVSADRGFAPLGVGPFRNSGGCYGSDAMQTRRVHHARRPRASSRNCSYRG